MELLIVIVIIGILAAISIVAYTNVQNQANDTTVRSDLRNTYMKLQEFYAEKGRFPMASGTGYQDELNSTFAVTRKAYHTGAAGALLYCRSDDQIAVIGRSLSGKGLYYSSSSSAGETDANFGLGVSATLCPQAGVPTTSPGYSVSWQRPAAGWQSWFTPGR